MKTAREMMEEFERRLGAASAEALRYWVRKWIYPSGSELEAAHNEVLRQICAELAQALAQDSRDAGLAIAVLSFLQRVKPVTHRISSEKTKRVERTPGYLVARATWLHVIDQALDVLEEVGLDPDILAEEPRRRLLRKRTLERYPTAIVQVKEDDPVRVATRTWAYLKRDGPRDRWVLTLVRYGEEDWTHPYYVRLGHISPKNLLLQMSIAPTPDGRLVYSFLVSHREPCRAGPGACEMAAATEIIREPDGVLVASPWRVRIPPVDEAFALAPHTGPTVRLGDVVVWASGWTPSDIRASRTPSFAERIQVKDAEPIGEGGEYGHGYGLRKGSVWVLTPKERSVRLAHQDHYAVEVQVPTRAEAILVREIGGFTQYRRRSGKLGGD